MHRRNRGAALASEILYCARCHRVILPREIKDGEYHFVDGDPVCRDCFTRLSRRLRPVTGQRAESKTQPIPVNLGDLEKELAKGTDGTQAFTPVTLRESPPPSSRLASYRSYRKPQTVFMACCFLVGLGAGALFYASRPIDKAPRSGTNRPPLPANGGGENVTTNALRRKAPTGGYLLAPEADASVEFGLERKYGTEPLLTLSCDEKGPTAEAYLRFDLSSITKPVKKAELDLAVAMSDSPNEVHHEALSVPATPWNEFSVNWRTKPGGLEVLGKWTLPPSAKSARVDITDAVSQAVQAGKPKLSLCLRLATGSAGKLKVIYHSRENHEGQDPALLVWPGAGELVRKPPTPATDPGKEPDPGEKPPDPEKPPPALADLKLPVPEGARALPAQADGFVHDGTDARKNFAKADRLLIKKSSSINREAFLRFDLSTIDRPVEKATLFLLPVKVGDPNRSKTENSLHYASELGWSEEHLTWAKKPEAGTKLWSWAPQHGKFVEIDLTSHVNNTIAKKGKLALRISSAKDVGHKGFVEYFSREGHERLGPTLVLVFKKIQEPDIPQPDPPVKTVEKRFTLVPRADTCTYAGDRRLNSGTDPELRVANYDDKSVRRAFIRFDISRIPGTIKSAQLFLFPFRQTGTGVAPLHRLSPVADNSWQEYKLTGKTPPKPGKAIAEWEPKKGKAVTITLTDQVATAMAGDKKISLEISAPHGSPRKIVVYYGSREGKKDNRPVLIVTALVKPGEKLKDPPQPLKTPPPKETTTEPVPKESPPPIGEKPGIIHELAPVADTYVADGSFAKTNYGHSSRLVVRTSSRRNRIAYVRFDLSGVSDSVLLASMSLTVDSTVRFRNAAEQEARLIGDHSWDESTLNWHTRPKADGYVATWTVKERGQIVNVDLTRAVKDALAKGGKALSLRIGSSKNNGVFDISYAARGSTVGRSPRLLVVCGKPLPGLKAKFYKTGNRLAAIPYVDGSSPDATRIVTQVDFADTTDPWKGLPPDIKGSFSSTFSGLLQVDKPGSYTFHLGSADGGRLLLDNLLLIDNNGVHAFEEESGKVDLKAGYHLLRVDHFSRSGSAGLTLKYEGAGIAKRTIPADKLFRVCTPQDSLLTVKCAADTYVSEQKTGRFTRTYGSFGSLSISTTNDNYSYLRFDLAGIRPPIASAKLRLTPASVATVKIPHALFFVPATTWNEAKLEYKTRPRYTDMIGGFLRSGNKPVEVDLTAWVRQALAGTKMFSFCIRPAKGFPAKTASRFCSRESRNDLGPRLLIMPKIEKK